MLRKFQKTRLTSLSDVDLRLLQVFRTIVTCGGLSAAELVLNIGRSTISKHLTDLEIRLGMKLCHRGPAGFALTTEGEQVFEASAHLQAAVDQFRFEVNDIHQQLVGTLTVGLFDKTVTNDDAFIARTFQAFDELAPRVSLRILVQDISEMERQILGGQVQVGIYPVHRKSTSLTYAPLYSEKMYLYCSAGHALFGEKERAVKVADIRACKYAGLGYQSPNMIASNKLSLKRVAESNSQEALALLILSDRYVGFLPDHFARPYVREGRMRALRPDQFNYETEFAAVTRKSPKPTRLAAAFLACLEDCHGT